MTRADHENPGRGSPATAVEGVKMLVLAAPGLKVPRENSPRDYVLDTPPAGSLGFEVPDTAYTRRRISDGDLFEVAAAEPSPEEGKDPGEGSLQTGQSPDHKPRRSR
ncbi:hypothetical protein [Accumulibacter sp.]|uniref:hypothetical protein n=1 Tax=Accumulibacter sp. TaxID=2053492 RepID=UPI0025E50F43|nr:hypothetical protein [Accumulibacter sp.]MCM8595135.1 DUF2635 domain-containing protein [Accumulibacter sp.]MCM8625521.1 DUF2635 domain-containing protein [Accumulibacter sp.]MDS4049281.1 hypothetical protein [Accumulibacter sp.]